jgi:hypothetical protein
MKVALIVVGALALLIAVVVVIGALLPKRHVVARSAVFKANAERLFALIAGDQQWRPDVKACQLIAGDGGGQFQRETSRHGETILYELEESRPPFAIKRRIASENLPYGGTWSFVLEPANGVNRVRITEDGEVYNPIFRFVSKFVMGQTATLDAYLKAMGKAVGENVQIEK